MDKYKSKERLGKRIISIILMFAMFLPLFSADLLPSNAYENVQETQIGEYGSYANSLLSGIYEIFETSPELGVFTYTINGEKRETGQVYFSDSVKAYINPIYASEGDEIIVTRAAQPDEFTYSNFSDSDIQPDFRIIYDIIDIGGPQEYLYPDITNNADGTVSYSFIMPAGYVRITQEFTSEDGWLQIFPLIGENEPVVITTDRPHGHAKAGESFEFTASSSNTKKVWLDVQTANAAGYQYVPFTFKTLGNGVGSVWDEFSAAYTADVPPDSNLPILITASQKPVLARYEFVGDMELTNLPYMHSDGIEWMFRTSYDRCGSVQLNFTAGAWQFIYDYGNYVLSVFDGFGNEMPYGFEFYPDDYLTGGEAKYMLWTPPLTPSELKTDWLNSDWGGLAGEIEAANRPTIKEICSNWNYPHYISDWNASFYIFLPDEYAGDTLNDITIKVTPALSMYNSISLTGSVNTGSSLSPLPSDLYSITAKQAVAGEKVTLCLYDTDEYTVDGVSWYGQIFTHTEIQKNRIYEMIMPNGAVTIDVQLIEVPDTVKYSVYKNYQVTKTGESAFSYAVTNTAGTKITKACEGEIVYLSKPEFNSGCGDLVSEWTLLDPPFALHIYDDGMKDVTDDLLTMADANTYSFIMPAGDILATPAASAEYKYYTLFVSEYIPDWFSGGGNFDNGTFGEITPQNILYVNNDITNKARCGEEVRLVIPKNKSAVYNWNSGGSGYWTDYLNAPSVFVTDSAGLRYELTPASVNAIMSEDYFCEYVFTMPDSDAVIDVEWAAWKQYIVPEVTVDTSSLPAAAPQPGFSIMYSGSDPDNANKDKYMIDMFYEDADYVLGFDLAAQAGVEFGYVTKFQSPVRIDKRSYVTLELWIEQDTVIPVIYEKLPDFPEISGVSQQSLYALYNDYIYLNARGLVKPTDWEHAFEFNVTYTFDGEETIIRNYDPVYDGTAIPFYQLWPFDLSLNTQWDESVTIPMRYTSHSDFIGRADWLEPAMADKLIGITISARRAYYKNDDDSRPFKTIAHIPIEFVWEITTERGEYPFISVTMGDDKKTFETWGNKSEKELQRLMASVYGHVIPQILGVSSASGFDYDDTTGIYTLKTDDGDAIAQIGSMLTAKVPQGKNMTVAANNGSVKITISKETKMSIPGHDIYVPSGATGNNDIIIELKKGTAYAFEYAEVYDDTTERPVHPEIIEVQWNNDVIPGWAQLGGALSANINNMQLFNNRVILGGRLYINVPVVGPDDGLVNIDVPMVRYSLVGSENNFYGIKSRYDGVKVNGSAALPPILGQFGVSASAKIDIDTITTYKYYRFEAAVKLFDIDISGELSLVTIDFKGKQQLVPDVFQLNVGTPSIEIIPGILQLSSPSGGFKDMAKTISGNYTLLPPLVLNIGASFSLVELLSGTVRASLGPSMLEGRLMGGFTFMGLSDILKYYKFGLNTAVHNNWAIDQNGNIINVTPGTGLLTQFEIGAETWVQVIPKFIIFNGKTAFKYGVFWDALHDNRTSFYFNIRGEVEFRVPEFKFLGIEFGPYTLLNISADINQNRAKGSAYIIGICHVSYTYNFKSNDDEFISYSSAEQPIQQAYAVVPLYNESGNREGELVIGDNLKTVAQSNQPIFAPVSEPVKFSPAAFGLSLAPAIQVQGNTHTITIPNGFTANGKGVMISLSLTPEEMTIFDPDGNPYPVSVLPADMPIGSGQAQSMAYNAIAGKEVTLVRLDGEGAWKIMGSKPFDSYVLEAAPMPKLTEVTLTGNSNSINVKAANLDPAKNYYVIYGLARTDNNGAEKLIELGAEKITGLANYNKTFVYDPAALANMLDSGDYYAYASLFTDIPGETDITNIPDADTVMFDTIDKDFLGTLQDSIGNTIKIVSSKAPADVTGITVSPAPDGGLKINWTGAAGADNYEIKVYEYLGIDQKGNPERIPVLTEDNTPLLYEVKSDGAVSHEAVIPNLEAAKNYTVEIISVQNEITPIDMGNGETHNATAVYRSGGAFAAGFATILEPQYPNVAIENTVYSDGVGLEMTVGENGGTFRAVSVDGERYNYSLSMQTIKEGGSGAYIDKQPLAAANNSLELVYNVPSNIQNALFILKVENPATHDTVELSVVISRYTIAPPLVLENLIQDDDADANGIKWWYIKSSDADFTISGVTLPFASVSALNSNTALLMSSDDNAPTPELLTDQADENGRFKISGTISSSDDERYLITALAAGGKTQEEIVVRYSDAVKYELTIQAGTGGTVSGTVSGSYTEGTAISVTATANSGYTFTGWTISGAALASNTANPAVFNMPENDVALTANFKYTGGDYVPEPTPAPQPTTAPASIITTKPQKNDSLKLPAGYTIETPKGKDPIKNADGSWTLPGGGKITTPKGTVINVPAKTAITADYTVKFSKDSGGAVITYKNNFTFNIGKDTEIILDPNDPLGYTVFIRNPFGDVSESDWFFNDVMFAYNHGLMVGTNADPMLFSPNSALTRGMVVTVLYRVSGSPNVSGLANLFDDVSDNEWYANAVKWAAANGIVNGYGDGRFGPHDNIKRQDLAVIIMRYMNYIKLGYTVPKEYRYFADEDEIADYAKYAIQDLNKLGVINGRGNDIIDPKGEATRAEFAAILHRFIKR